MRICGQNQPSDAESIEIRVSLTSKHGCRVSLATYIQLYTFGLHRELYEKNDELLSRPTEAMFGAFVYFFHIPVSFVHVR